MDKPRSKQQSKLQTHENNKMGSNLENLQITTKGITSKMCSVKTTSSWVIEGGVELRLAIPTSSKRQLVVRVRGASN